MAIPVVLDTDLGDDIDDTWALALLLRCPELCLQLVLTAGHGFHDARAKIAAKLLRAAGIEGVTIGLGCVDAEPKRPFMYQRAWAEEVDLKQWETTSKGKLKSDGVGQLIELVMCSVEPITIIAIGPMDNIAEALRREPRIAERARFVSMLGSIDVGYFGLRGPVAEFNVAMNPVAVRTVLRAPWLEKIITPLDSCGLFALAGKDLERFRASRTPLSLAIEEASQIWYAAVPEKVKKYRRYPNPSHSTTYLFDCVAVHLAYSSKYFQMKRLPVCVTIAGMTQVAQIDSADAMIDVAIECEDTSGFTDFVVRRLTSLSPQLVLTSSL